MEPVHPASRNGRAVGLACLAVAVAALAAAAAVPGAGPGPGGKTVRDAGNRFTLRIPSTWEVYPPARGQALLARGPAGTGALPDTLDVIVEDTAMPLSPAACVGEAERFMRFAIHSWTDLGSAPTTVGGRPAYEHTYVWQASTGNQRRSVQVCVTQGRRAFMLIGTTENTPAQPSAGLLVIMRIIDSFRINPEAPPPAPLDRGSQGA
jgi:hypothetical protein